MNCPFCFKLEVIFCENCNIGIFSNKQIVFYHNSGYNLLLERNTTSLFERNSGLNILKLNYALQDVNPNNIDYHIDKLLKLVVFS